MFTQISQALDVYRSEVKSYVEWSNGRIAHYGTDNLLQWDRQDENKIRFWDAKLRGMVLALNLTKEEEEQIDRECGVISKR